MRSTAARRDEDIEEKNNGRKEGVRTEVTAYFDIVSINGPCSKNCKKWREKEKGRERERERKRVALVIYNFK